MYQSNNIVFDFLVEEILIMGWIRDSSEEARLPLKPSSNSQRFACIEIFGRSFLTLSGGEKQREFSSVGRWFNCGDQTEKMARDICCLTSPLQAWMFPMSSKF